MTPEERQEQIKQVLKRQINEHPDSTIILYTNTTKDLESCGAYGLIVAFLSTYPDRKNAKKEYAQFNKRFRCGRIVAISTLEERQKK